MYLDRLKKKHLQLGHIFRKKVKPCTIDEIDYLESNIGFSLPKSYREFMLWGGHKTGGLMDGSDFFFEHLLPIQETAREILSDDEFEKPLPQKAFIFLMHQDYQFLFFDAGEGENPFVYSYRENQAPRFFEKHYRYTDFLLDILEKEAIFRESSI